MEEKWEIIEPLKHHCYICKERLQLLCGTPKVVVGGCCSGIKDLGGKVWIFPVSAHFHCYLKDKQKTKAKYDKKTALRLLREHWERMLEIRQRTFKDKILRKDKKYMKETREKIKRDKSFLKQIEKWKNNNTKTSS